MRISSRAVILDNKNVLMNEFENGLYYNFPSGGIEEGEIAKETVIREVFEEIGLRVEVLQLLFVLDYEPVRNKYQGGNERSIALFFLCSISGKVKETPTVLDYDPIHGYKQTGSKWIPVKPRHGRR